MVHVTVFIHHHHHHYACPSLCMNDDRRRASRMEAERERERWCVSPWTSSLPQQAGSLRGIGLHSCCTSSCLKGILLFSILSGALFTSRVSCGSWNECCRAGLFAGRTSFSSLIEDYHLSSHWWKLDACFQQYRQFPVRAVLLHGWLDNVTYFTDKTGTWISHTGNQTSASLP